MNTKSREIPGCRQERESGKCARSIGSAFKLQQDEDCRELLRRRIGGAFVDPGSWAR